MSLQTKLQTLTENLKKSQLYHKKIQEEIARAHSDTLECKLNIADFTQKITNSLSQEHELDGLLLRIKQEEVRHKYRIQKLQLRRNQLMKKVSLQSQILERKNKYKEQLMKKIENLEKCDESMCQIDVQIEDKKLELLELENMIEQQKHKYNENHQKMLSEGKKVRTKQDEVSRLELKNSKLKKQLSELEKAISSSQNKENICENVDEKTVLEKLKDLESQKSIINKDINKKMVKIQKIIEVVESLGYENTYIKQLLGKEEETLQMIRLQKSYLNKKKQLSTEDTKQSRKLKDNLRDIANRQSIR